MNAQFDYKLSYPADVVWALVADFGGKSWQADLRRVETHGEGIGMTRSWYWPHVKKPTVHRLEKLDHDTMTLSLSVLSEHMPLLRGAYSTISITPLSRGSCRMTIAIELDAQHAYHDDIVKVLKGWIDRDIKDLKKRLTREN